MLARRAATKAQEAGDRRAEAIASRALGLAARELHDLPASTAHLRRAVGLAQRHGHPEEAARARMVLAGTLAMRGEWPQALREVDRAAPALRGLDLGLLQLQRGTLLTGQGRLQEAIGVYGHALPVLRRAGDPGWVALLLTNRGLARFQAGELSAAIADLRTAEAHFESLGQGRAVARVHQSLGLVAGRQGDIPAALEWFERAEAWFSDHDRPEAMLFHDRCDTLLAARLVTESRECAATAVRLLTEEGRLGYAATARLKLAEAALADGDAAAARRTAEDAARALTRQRRPALAALARQVSLRARWLAGDRSAALLAAARRNADRLAGAGFALHALDARILAAQLALERGRPLLARAELTEARRARRQAPAQIQTRVWHAEALLRLSVGNRRGAESALRAGMRVVDRYRITLGATELRANASGHVVELAGLGLGLAVREGDPRQVLGWAERSRAGAVVLRPARPPDDERLAASLGALRAVVAELEGQAASGRPTSQLLARQAALEEDVRDRARCATGVLAASAAPPPPLEMMLSSLGEARLVELVEHDGALLGVTVHRGRARMARLGPSADAGTQLDRLRFSLRRLAFRTGSAASRAAVRDAATFGAGVLDELLLAPLGVDERDAPLLIVPTGRLHAVPWSALPRCRGRAVSVAPSLAAWHRAATVGPVEQSPVVLVAGPNLEHAAGEVAALGRLYRGSRRLTGPRATTAAVLSALDGAGLAHIAAHGRFRADNPLFSCLELADGPVTVYDLESLSRAPATLVLAACDAGLSQVRPGDELMGLAAAVLALGTRALVASVFPVPDEDTQAFMLAFHRHVRAGLGPAAALAEAVETSPEQWPSSATFTCFGAG